MHGIRPGHRIRDDLGHVLVGITGTLEGIEKLRNGLHVVVVVVSDPEPLDTAEAFLFDQFSDVVDTSLVAGVQDERRLVFRNDHPTRAIVSQATWHFHGRPDGHMARPALELLEELGEIMTERGDSDVAVVALVKLADEFVDGTGRIVHHVAVRRNNASALAALIRSSPSINSPCAPRNPW